MTPRSFASAASPRAGRKRTSEVAVLARKTLTLMQKALATRGLRPWARTTRREGCAPGVHGSHRAGNSARSSWRAEVSRVADPDRSPRDEPTAPPEFHADSGLRPPR